MAERYGGAIYADQSTIRLTGSTTFMENKAQNGGAVYCENTSLSFNGNSIFTKNMAEWYVGKALQFLVGGAVYAGYNNTLYFNESSFMRNTAGWGGAVIAWNKSTLSFSGCSFMNNTADHDGGAVYAEDNNTLSFDGNSSFMSNTAGRDGGAVYGLDSNTLSFSGNSSFMSNAADRNGGAVRSLKHNALSFNGDSSFVSNTAMAGGAVYTDDNNTFSFNGYSIFMSNTAYDGGALCALDNNNLSFNGNSNFMGNTAAFGGAVCAGNTNTLSLNGKSSFVRNTADYNGGAVLGWARNTLSFSWNSSLMNNTAGHHGGAVFAVDSNTLSFIGSSIFNGNTASDGGAVFVLDSNTLSFNGNSSFISNTANLGGGAVFAMNRNTLSFNGKSSFMRNTAERYNGGAVYVTNHTTLSFIGDSNFTCNTANHDGGAVYAQDSNSLSFNGSISFMSNIASGGGAVHAHASNTLSFNGNSGFMSNAAEYAGGSVCVRDNNTLSLKGNSSFMTNTAGSVGGALFALNSNILSFNGSSSFINNTADHEGGAVYVRNSDLTFHGSSVFGHNEAVIGGGLTLVSNSLLHSSGATSLLRNTASFGGGAFIRDSRVDFTENITVIGNKAIHGGGLFVQSSDITLQGTGLLAGNTGTNPVGGYGGAISSLNSIVEFKGSFNLTNNTADFGGGLSFFGVNDGVFLIKDGSTLTFEGNLAHRRGGAIYVEDDPFTFCAFDSATQNKVDEVCFFQTREGPYNCFVWSNDSNINQATSITLAFNGNTANVSGDIMYGGRLEAQCVVCSAYSPGNTYGVETFRKYAESEGDVFSKLSSNPYKVCICEDGQPECDLREVNRTVYPGQTLVISLVAVGQMNGTVPSVIRAVSDDLIGNPDFQETQPAENSKQCSQLQYPMLSNISNTTLKLYSDEPCSTSGYPLTFVINFLPCPVGFTLSEKGACICDERLQSYTQNCNVESITINRNADASFWVGVEGTDKLILHPHCPFDYCTEKPIYFQINRTDIQCANGRSGTLCGACQPGHGLALGSSRCLSDCSDTFLALLLAFAFAGVALVAFLFLCHFTVAEGTMSGLIFYANVLAVNQTVFFPSGERNLLTVFIAWLNLDLGIETCFFISLDVYYRTWLQFAFPIYIWVMVGAIIVLADRLTAFANIIGSTNPVAVLATLFLLSYTKLLRAIMAAFSFTTLDYPDGDNKYVWLYDGNIGYLDRHDGRHIALFLFSLLFLLFIFLPYTLLLLCGQWIQKQLWWLSSTKQLYLKFFLDAHYGPYKYRHRYWTGLLLLLRFLMQFIATIININNPQDPYTNLLVILVVSSSLVVWGWVVGRMYKKWYHDILEATFILNLVVLSGATYQVRQSGGNQAALVYVSVSIAFVTFFGIIVSAVVKRVKEKVAEHRRRAVHHLTNDSPDDEEDSEQLVPVAAPTSAVTYSVLKIVRNHPDQTSGEIELRPLTGECPDSTS